MPTETALPTQDRMRLLELLRARSFEEREVILSSGKRSNFYIDVKRTSLTAEGHLLIGRLLLAELRRFEARRRLNLAAAGGLTLGADPLASALSLTSALSGSPLDAFIVRKEPKAHGTKAAIEGAAQLPAGASLAVLEDVVTTGASAIRAIQESRLAGFSVPLVLAIVDRQEGGKEAIEGLGPELISLFVRDDFIRS